MGRVGPTRAKSGLDVITTSLPGLLSSISLSTFHAHSHFYVFLSSPPSAFLLRPPPATSPLRPKVLSFPSPGSPFSIHLCFGSSVPADSLEKERSPFFLFAFWQNAVIEWENAIYGLFFWTIWCLLMFALWKGNGILRIGLVNVCYACAIIWGFWSLTLWYTVCAWKKRVDGVERNVYAARMLGIVGLL